MPVFGYLDSYCNVVYDGPTQDHLASGSSSFFLLHVSFTIYMKAKDEV